MTRCPGRYTNNRLTVARKGMTLRLFALLVGFGLVLATEPSVSELQESIEKLTKVTQSLTVQLRKSELKNAELAATVEKLEERVNHMEKERDSRHVIRQLPLEIGFMATTSQPETHLHLDQTIIYDLVITNIGNAYDPQTGLFKCPVAGTYLFNFNIMADDSNYVEASLSINGNHIVHALSDHNDDGTSWDMGTTNAIVRLSEGDVVSVNIQWPAGENTVHGNRYNTFSGYLLKQQV